MVGFESFGLLDASLANSRALRESLTAPQLFQGDNNREADMRENSGSQSGKANSRSQAIIPSDWTWNCDAPVCEQEKISLRYEVDVEIELVEKPTPHEHKRIPIEPPVVKDGDDLDFLLFNSEDVGWRSCGKKDARITVSVIVDGQKKSFSFEFPQLPARGLKILSPEYQMHAVVRYLRKHLPDALRETVGLALEGKLAAYSMDSGTRDFLIHTARAREDKAVRVRLERKRGPEKKDPDDVLDEIKQAAVKVRAKGLGVTQERLAESLGIDVRTFRARLQCIRVKWRVLKAEIDLA
jgi:hypothetical protein